MRRSCQKIFCIYGKTRCIIFPLQERFDKAVKKFFVVERKKVFFLKKIHLHRRWSAWGSVIHLSTKKTNELQGKKIFHNFSKRKWSDCSGAGDASTRPTTPPPPSCTRTAATTPPPLSNGGSGRSTPCCSPSPPSTIPRNNTPHWSLNSCTRPSNSDCRHDDLIFLKNFFKKFVKLEIFAFDSLCERAARGAAAPAAVGPPFFREARGRRLRAAAGVGGGGGGGRRDDFVFV